MKRIRFVSTGVLFLLLGTTTHVYAQHDQEGKGQEGKGQGNSQQGQEGQQRQQGQPAQQQGQQHKIGPPEHRQQPQQQQHQQQASQPAQRQVRPQQTYGGAYHGGVKADVPTYGGVHASGVPQHQRQVRSGFVESRASSWDNDHRTWGQRGGYNGYRVPDDRFRLYFGSDHYFRIYALPLVFVGGYPRFQYDGYWVTLVDSWPETWPDTWYESDDVYLDYSDDGYYVYNRTRPGPGIAVTIAF
jgi:hypothetical protein